MAQSGYAEGDIADGPNGTTAVFTNGKWVVQGSQQMPLPQGDEPAIKDLQTQADDTAWLAQKARQFRQMQAGQGGSPVQTGPMFKEVGIPHIADNINPLPMIANALDPAHRVGQLESISNQAWAHMRPSGSGSLKAPEIEGFKQAFPNVGNWGGENNGIAGRLQTDAITAASKLKFVDNFIRSGRGTFADANAAWTQQMQPQQAAPAQTGSVPAIPPPMQMTADANSPIGAVPAEGVAPPPVDQQTPQQAAIINWDPHKGFN